MKTNAKLAAIRDRAQRDARMTRAYLAVTCFTFFLIGFFGAASLA